MYECDIYIESIKTRKKNQIISHQFDIIFFFLNDDTYNNIIMKKKNALKLLN